MHLSTHPAVNLWNKLWKKNQSVVLSPTNIRLEYSPQSLEILLDSLVNISIEKGLFFHRLVIETEDNGVVVLKGYRQSDLMEFTQKTIDSLLLLIASSDRWLAYQDSLAKLHARSCYLSSYEWRPIASAYQLVCKLQNLGISPDQLTSPLHRSVYEEAKSLSSESVSELGRNLHNEQVTPLLVSKYKRFFDEVEKNPLTDKQRIACVTNDDHNLVIAGAGTGKTATLVGKAGYLIQANIAKAENILMLAFGNKAAAEMNERIKDRIPANADHLKASTFHALGNDILARHHGFKRSITSFTEQPHQFTKFIDETLSDLAEHDPLFKSALVNYFSSLSTPGKSDLDFDSIEEYNEFLSSCRLITLNNEWVKSVGELRVANYLALNGIKYEYEADYKFNTRSVDRRQYQPDFYLPDVDLYIEYLGLDENHNTAPYIDRDEYLASLEWKRELHESKGTRMLELYTYQLQKGQLQSSLEAALNEYEVLTQPVEVDALFKQLKEQNESQWQGFIDLLQRFLGLYKEGQFDSNTVRDEYRGGGYDIERTEAFLRIFEPILMVYQEHLANTECIDFSDMISEATDIIEKSRFHHSYTHVLVDEFQDISGGRYKLLKALLASKPNIRLFAVGDDWQSIYRFNGADLALFTEFSAVFNPATAVPLDKTFRFNDKIHEVSSRFVMTNPAQIKKEISTHAMLDAPAVRLVDVKKDMENLKSISSVKERKNQAYVISLQRALATLNRTADRKGEVASVLIIGRFRQENTSQLKGINVEKFSYTNLDISFVTAHASKGLEADYVILFGVDTGVFPSTRENDELIDLVLPNKESFIHGEERRLFYVALTRAKHFVYVLFDGDKSSPFLSEMAKFGLQFVDNKLAPQLAKWNCSQCKTGELRPLTTRYNKTLYKCSHSPACDTLVNSCKHCNSPLETHTEGFRRCRGCGEIEIGCLRCGIGTMVARCENDPNRETFYGCNRFRRGADDSCGENIKIGAYEERMHRAGTLADNNLVKNG
ncbi:UvrD-helicase domain-containing protein [Vibrio splendidus]|uniref:UvrD-helicase domain-containing protein n=1 Tax=Vibrio splendidus TaxID=29497 RepID=UPI001FB3FE04|nr:UvrD-helicase domain-containing protein [Vibrio splendidus]UOE85037.1 UvrD-helicase domain-containing protein [Vibrio splendidus]UOE89480.1 UvrD-helicase domain-containing protein [Vibrio splendidus]